MNQQNEPVIKDLRTTKKLLRNDLDMHKKELAKYINPIIAENRSIDIEDAKKVHKVRHTEVLKLYAKIGEDIQEMRKLSA